MTGHKYFFEDRVKIEKERHFELGSNQERHKDWILDQVCVKNRDATRENTNN